MPEVHEKRVELILQQLEELPTLPAVVLQVLELTADDASSAAQVVHLIESDPALTARILQLVHRADRGIASHAQSVERAVVMLGFQAVRNAAIAASIFESFPAAETGRAHNRSEIWKHCVAVACCAELLAEAMASGGLNDPIDPSTAFLCGLLHDLGKIALDAALPKSFARVVEAADLLRGNIADVERRVIGLDHMVVGKRLAERWKLPESVRDCAWLHGQLPQALPAGVKSPKLVNLITLADQLAREQHLGYSGNYTSTVLQQTLLDSLGLKHEQIEAAMRLLVERIEPRAKALALGEADSSELYQEALAQANRELGRVSGQLQAKNRRLAVRAQFFDALSGFQSGLRADVAVQEVLRAIAQTAVTVLGVPAVAAFSLPPDRNFAEAVLCGPTGNVFETSLIDLPGTSKSDAPVVAMRDGGGRPQLLPGDGPVMPTGEDLEWLVSAISPRLPHAKRFWISLTTHGLCAGGVVWGADPGEAHRLGPQAAELSALAQGWSLALRTAQVREESRDLAEQLADSHRQLQAAQTQILRSRTMISVGEMAAGAAHEMNNPLAVISGRSQLLASQLTDPKLKAAAHLIHEQSHRLSAIITELMAFARPEAPSLQESDMAELLDRALHEAKMHNDPADRVIELTMGEIPSARVDPQQLTAALSEVMDNAIQATDPATGHIAVHAAFDSDSSQIVVTITDDGCGMDEATLKRAFDPFFSSKPAGRRRGLGLAKALRWIEASGGSIRLESRLGQGARTTVLLPAAPRLDEPMTGQSRRAENF